MGQLVPVEEKWASYFELGTGLVRWVEEKKGLVSLLGGGKD